MKETDRPSFSLFLFFFLPFVFCLSFCHLLGRSIDGFDANFSLEKSSHVSSFFLPLSYECFSAVVATTTT